MCLGLYLANVEESMQYPAASRRAQHAGNIEEEAQRATTGCRISETDYATTHLGEKLAGILRLRAGVEYASSFFQLKY